MTRSDIRRRNIALTTIALLIVLLVASTAAPQIPTDYFPSSEWRAAKPKKQGLNKKILKSLANRLRTNQIRDLNSLLIVRNGYLVVEEYFNGSGPEDVHTLQSDSKSITSLLVGIALQQGNIHSVDDKVLTFFPEYEPIKRLDERKAALTIRDLLTMRTGLDWSEDDYNTSPLKELNECGCDWLRFVLNWQMREMPGTRFEYNSGGVILLGGIIRSVTGRAVDSFAEQYLFSPLGIKGARWFQGLPEGLPHMGGGLNLRATDMARIGYLLLRKGRWEDQQIVSQEWLQESTRHWVSYPRTFSSHRVDYGYLWWLLPLDDTDASHGEDADVYTAAGARDQWIFVIPKYDMVVVVTGNTSATFAQPVDFLYTDILRAVE
ncbi:MAG TPA: serine hydrolase [Blastocatellia bacterium]|nr:serine hydrolase [Blastocatellia bacterium]